MYTEYARLTYSAVVDKVIVRFSLSLWNSIIERANIMVSVASRRLFQLNSTRVIAYKVAPVNFLRTFTSTHKLSFSTDPDVTTPPSKLTLYQYQICPFCNKTKALLNYASINYETVEVNPLTKAELKPW